MLTLSYIFVGLAVVFAVLELLFFITPLRIVGRSKTISETSADSENSDGSDGSDGSVESDKSDESDQSENSDATSALPKLSVIVYVVDTNYDNDLFMEQVMSQTYPDFEVILVYESNAETAAMIAEKYSARYPNVYVTFIPPGSHNLSIRKLAFTIGMKAAKGDIVVTTANNVSIPSTLWLEQIASPFVGDGRGEERGEKKDVALGYSKLCFADLRGPWRWYREFDTQMTDSVWIAYAMRQKPYRGDSNNLAFRRELFFQHKGYSGSLNLQNGDDDLFVNDITTSDNAEMILSADTILESEWGKSANHIWAENKERYSFTSRWLPRRPFVMSGISSALQWLVAGSVAASAILSLPAHIVPTAVSTAIMLIFWLWEITLYRRCAERMQNTRLWWSVPLFMLMRPVVNFFFRMGRYRNRKQNYTWQRTRRHKK